jgi:hypothetical protein
MRPEAPAGALGVDYGDFSLQEGGKGPRIRQKFAILGQFFPIYFPILILFLLFQLFIGITEVRGR